MRNERRFDLQLFAEDPPAETGEPTAGEETPQDATTESEESSPPPEAEAGIDYPAYFPSPEELAELEVRYQTPQTPNFNAAWGQDRAAQLEWFNQQMQTDPIGAIQSVAGQAMLAMMQDMYRKEIAPMQKQSVQQREVRVLEQLNSRFGGIDDKTMDQMLRHISSRPDLQQMSPENRISLAYMHVVGMGAGRQMERVAAKAKQEALRDVGRGMFSAADTSGRSIQRASGELGLSMSEREYASKYDIPPEEYSRRKSENSRLQRGK